MSNLFKSIKKASKKIFARAKELVARSLPSRRGRHGSHSLPAFRLADAPKLPVAPVKTVSNVKVEEVQVELVVSKEEEFSASVKRVACAGAVNKALFEAKMRLYLDSFTGDFMASTSLVSAISVKLEVIEEQDFGFELLFTEPPDERLYLDSIFVEMITESSPLQEDDECFMQVFNEMPFFEDLSNYTFFFNASDMQAFIDFDEDYNCGMLSRSLLSSGDDLASFGCSSLYDSSDAIGVFA